MRTTISHLDWLEKGKRLFGDDVLQWRFVCPKCKTIQTAKDLLDAGVKKEDVDGFLGFSCIGRFTKDKGCNWTLGGLFTIHTLEVQFEDSKRPIFEFDECEQSVKP